MSKIGRRPIDLGNVKIDIKDQEVHLTGKNFSDVYLLPEVIKAEKVDNTLKLTCSKITRENNTLWGLHRALLANKIKGADKGFERELNITGLGYKGVLSGDKIIFSLGFSHKIDFPLPEGVKVEIDKTGQNIKVKGTEKEKIGLVASKIRSLRPPEPYKATGIKFADERIIRKAGKTKSA